LAIVTAVGPRAEVKAIATVFSEKGWAVDVFVEPGEGGDADTIVQVIRVTSADGIGIPAGDANPLLDHLRESKTGSYTILFASDRQARRIKWIHDGDECIAEVGEQLKWRRLSLKLSQGARAWNYGRTVWHIEPGPTTWRVQLSLVERPDGWESYLMCGDSAEVAWFRSPWPKPDECRPD
jgi:hypothetical protein